MRTHPFVEKFLVEPNDKDDTLNLAAKTRDPMHITINSDFEYKWGILSSQGTVQIDVAKAMFEIDAEVIEQDGLESEQVTAFKVTKADSNYDVDASSVVFKGDNKAVDWMLNHQHGWYKDKILQKLSDMAIKTATDDIQTTLNQKLLKNQFFKPIQDALEVDFSLINAPLDNSGQLFLDFDGMFVLDTPEGKVRAPVNETREENCGPWPNFVKDWDVAAMVTADSINSAF